MNEALKMQISAFVDGELPANESELLLRRLSQDADLRQQVAAYLRIGRIIRRDREVPGMEGLRGRIMAALGEQAEERVAEPEALGSRFMTPATGVAVAATVAALAIFGLRQLDPDTTAAAPGVDTTAQVPSYTEPAVPEVLPGESNELLMQYYHSHDDSAGGILTRMRQVNFEARQGELEVTEPDPHLFDGDETGESEPAADATTNEE